MMKDAKLHKKNKKSDEKNMPYIFDAYKVAIVYAIFGGLWILLSDKILGFIFPDLKTYKSIQTYKGVLYVLITTLLVYELLRRRLKLWHIEYKKREEAFQELKLINEELVKLDAELTYQKKLNENIIMEAPSIIITWDDTGRILSINPFGEKLTGYTEEELINGPGWKLLVPEERFYMAIDTYFEIKDMDEALIYDGAVITKDGRRVDILWSSKTLFQQSDEGGKKYVSIGTDLEERKRYEEKIKHMAYYDTLTNLPNRLMFEQMVSKHIRDKDSSFAIAYMDIDNFKNINDSIGHKAGDVFLKYFANTILENVEESAFVARLGGDEFAILYKYDSKEGILEKVESLLKQTNRIWSHDNRLFYISTSVGIVLYPENGDNTSELLMNADIAMYASKREGRNRILFYKSDLMEENSRYGDMANNLQEGMDQQQFYLVYQPQYNLYSKELIGMEALLRWEHPSEGFISPGDFIPIAERTGQIYRLERWVIRKALEQRSIWEQQGYGYIQTSINLSTKTLTSAINFAEWEQILSEYDVDYSKIIIEITETADILDVENVIGRLNILKKRGIRIALDDFGTGYSSLNYLKKFPIDIIKLDRSFINAITEEGVDTLLIKNILKLANDLKFEVIAEGIETYEQMQLLVDYNCESGQGFLLSKPLTVENIFNLLNNYNK
ncbi:MAG: EAL domain-containing protein [Clostridiales bacterium]|jgi:diguanylate cyclase (GGDEF)-like protein/PAS domain S-box-containing protein|nr:EAL domain-containing protein [Clostridiales bacterium]